MSKRSGRCASAHLISGVHLQCLLDFWLRKCNQFIYFSVVSHSERFCTEQHASKQSNFYFNIIVILVVKYSN